MNWKKVLSDFLIYAGLIFVCFTFSDWALQHSHLNSRVLIENALGSSALVLGWVGFEELHRGGHRKIRLIYFICTLILIFGFIILRILNNGWDVAFEKSIFAIWAIFAIPFPLALYLNRHQNNSTSQSTIDNAS